jgi:hypothetical protein
MLKNIEEKKRLIIERKQYLEEMIMFAELYERSGDNTKKIIHDIIKVKGQISLLIKKQIESL